MHPHPRERISRAHEPDWCHNLVVAYGASNRRRFERAAAGSAVVALWIVVQLALGAPLRALGAAAHRDGEIATDSSRDIVVARTSDRPFHRLSLQAPPFVNAQRVSAMPPAACAGTVLPPRTHAIACARHARFAGPRGPPRVTAS